MQTFLPYPDYARSAACLDRSRLGKQRVEVLQLLNALLEGGGWSNHPAARMWRGHEGALGKYGRAVCAAWTSRGYQDTCHDKIGAVLARHPAAARRTRRPPWLGDPRLHASHRSRLLSKDFAWYGQFDWPEARDVARGEVLEYYWPV